MRKEKKSSYFIGVSIGVNGVAGVASVTRNSITFLCVSHSKALTKRSDLCSPIRIEC